MSLRFATLLDAMRKATSDLLRPALLWHALWPPLAAFLACAAVAWFAWQPLAQWVAAQLPEWPWFGWFAPWIANVMVFALFFAPSSI